MSSGSGTRAVNAMVILVFFDIRRVAQPKESRVSFQLAGTSICAVSVA
jgi:hypothetical protein